MLLLALGIKSENKNIEILTKSKNQNILKFKSRNLFKFKKNL